MSKSLTPAVRRQIIAFNPAEPGAPSVAQFCRELGVSRPSFYKVRERFATEGNAASNRRSRAPKEPAHRYDEDTAEVVLGVRKRLAGNGWDAGPISIWHACVDEGLFTSSIPSVSTIARILAAAGVVDANPRKRPRSSYIRFQRAAAMELWQLDALEYAFFNDTAGGQPVKVTIYQLLDDSTRYDVGTQAFADPENGDDAVSAVSTALTTHGVPQELLSDNGGAFNLARQGAVTPVAAAAGRPRLPGHHRGVPLTDHAGQGRALPPDPHTVPGRPQPTTLQRVRELLVEYREYYNHRRHHQSLPGRMTPGQAWAACEHRPSNGVPIPHADLEAAALAYVDRSVADAGPGDGPPAGQDPQHTASGRLREAAGEIVITRDNPQIYLHGRIYKVPVHLVGSYMPVIADTEYALFDLSDGAESIRLPLPVQTKETGSRVVPLWKVRGARIRDPKPSWTHKHLAYEAEHYPAHVPDVSTKS